MIKSELEAVNLPLQGAFLIKPKEFYDERGAFHKLYTRKLLESKGVGCFFAEEYLSISKKGTLRGFHYQTGKFGQAKLVRCVHGEVFDVIVDLGEKSPTFGNWYSVRLSEENRLGLYIPRTFAHGFLAMEDGSALLYKADSDYSPQHEAGIIWNDKRLNVAWPKMERYIISEKDGKWPAFDAAPKF